MFFSFLAAVKFTVLVNEPSEEGCVSLPGWYFMPDLRSSNAIFSTVTIRLYILAGVVQDDDSSISLGLWMTMWSKLPPTVVTTVQDWGLGQVTPKYVSVAYWLLWFSYLGNSQWKRDTFLSASLKAGNKLAIWNRPFLYLEIERHHYQQMQGIQGWEVNLVTSLLIYYQSPNSHLNFLTIKHSNKRFFFL